jgi:hypothetical protein
MARRAEPELTPPQRLLFGLLGFGVAVVIGMLVWWYASDASPLRWIVTAAGGLIGGALAYWWLAGVGHPPRVWWRRRPQT